MTLYFTWPDRGFSYRCADCGACCRGLGIGFDAKRELVAVISKYPQLASFVRKRGAAVTAFNPRGRCWFLDDGGLCRIETEHGRDLKPASCRLFPFNRVFQIGGHTIVDYNSVVCPLQVVGDGSGIAHADVAKEIESVTDPAVVGTELPVGADGGDGFVAKESAIAGACFEQARAAVPDLGAVWSVLGSERSFADAGTALSAALECIIGEPLAIDDVAATQTGLWLTPSLRFNELFGPRHYADEKVLGRQWLAWLHLLCAGATLAQRAPTLQEATSSWSELMPLAYVLARWHEYPWLQPGPVELPTDGDAAAKVRRFGEACTVNRSAKRSLGQIVESIVGVLPTHERVMAVRALEPLLPALRFGIPETSNRRKKRRRK